MCGMLELIEAIGTQRIMRKTHGRVDGGGRHWKNGLSAGYVPE